MPPISLFKLVLSSLSIWRMALLVFLATGISSLIIHKTALPVVLSLVADRSPTDVGIQASYSIWFVLHQPATIFSALFIILCLPGLVRSAPIKELELTPDGTKQLKIALLSVLFLASLTLAIFQAIFYYTFLLLWSGQWRLAPSLPGIAEVYTLWMTLVMLTSTSGFSMKHRSVSAGWRGLLRCLAILIVFMLRHAFDLGSLGTRVYEVICGLLFLGLVVWSFRKW